MTSRLDLSQDRITLPELPKPHVPRDNLVKWLCDRFTKERKSILVQGPSGSGKTVLLSQFVYAFPDRCFSYFVGTDIYSSSSRWFLLEMCSQMNRNVGDSNQVVDDRLNQYELKEQFRTLYRRVAKKARRAKEPFYFVIDGLDQIPDGYGEESILDLLPKDPPFGIYVLASSSHEPDVSFDELWQIPLFSVAETEMYLQDLELEHETVKRIHDACEGMPGYLAQIRREIQSGLPINEVLTDDLPKGIRNLHEREWARAKLEKENILNALAVLAYAELPLDIPQLANIIGSSINDLEIDLASVPFVRLEADKRLHFITNTHRHFVADKLTDLRGKAEAMLIKHYEQEQYSEDALHYLPVLYKQSGQYSALKQLINPEYLMRTLEQKHSLDLLRRNARIIADMAHKEQDWDTLFHYSLLSSVIKTLSTKATAEAEIDALLALEDYQQSFEQAYRVILPEDRLQLLAKVSSHLKQQGLSLPETMFSELEHMVDIIEPTDLLKERLVEIAADLFYVHPQAATKLVDKVAGVADGKLMDIVLAVLSLRLGDEADSVGVRSRISDQSLRDFTRANSPVVAKLKPEQVITEAYEISDTSGQLFLLRSWCNANRNNPEALRVINEALEIMTRSTDYFPSMRHLRQFAEPLVVCRGEGVSEAVARFDLLKDTAIEKPAEELVRLELVLATAETHDSPDKAISRLYLTYFDLDTISELDARCYCLARILLSLPQIAPEDKKLRQEIEQQLREEYRTLLKESAEHWAITRRLIAALTNYNPEMAVEFANQLNIQERRDRAYGEILRVYTDREPNDIDLSLVETILDKISDTEQRIWTFVRVLKRFAQKDMFACRPESRCFMDKVGKISDPRAQSFARAYMSQMMASAGQSKTAQEQFKRMIESWSLIDAKWEQVSIGFDLVTIVAKETPELARDFFEKIRTERASTPLAEELLADLYIHVIKLAIRAFPDILKNDDYTSYRKQLIEMIERIPSNAVQCQLMADLALIHELSGKHQDFEGIVKNQVLHLLESGDDESRSQTVIKIAPCLFCYERNILAEYVSQLSSSRRDEAFWNVVKYLLSKSLSDDPIDLDSMITQVEYRDALQACEVISEIETDAVIYDAIDRLVDSIIQQTDPQNERCVFFEKQSLGIAKNLVKIINEKLPDQNNIEHPGYQIASMASLARLRAAQKGRAKTQWEPMIPSWADIAHEARNIPNAADRALVMAIVGEKMYRSEVNLGHRLLDEANSCINDIPNLIDKANRFYAVAEAWKQVNDKESAKMFLREAMTILEAWHWDRTRDQVTGQILQLAHSIDPEFASSLTSTVDNPVIQYGLQQDLITYDLRHKPEKIQERLNIESYTVGQAAWQLLESFCSGRGHIQLEKVVGQWVYSATNAEFDDAYKIMAWSIENSKRRTQTRAAPALNNIYRGLLDLLDLIIKMGVKLLSEENELKSLAGPPLSMPPDLRTFQAGEQTDAELELQKWLGEKAQSYVRIYDAYFTTANLHILKHIDPAIRVDVLTLWKSQRISFGNRDIQQQYQDAWNAISDQTPSEVHIHIMGIRSTGDGPIHDRYIITQGGGLYLGSSIDGLGLKDTSIHLLNSDEAAQVESEFITPLLLGSQRLFKGEKLEVFTFTL